MEDLLVLQQLYMSQVSITTYVMYVYCCISIQILMSAKMEHVILAPTLKDHIFARVPVDGIFHAMEKLVLVR